MSIIATLVKISLVLSICIVPSIVSPAYAESSKQALERVKGTRVSIIKPEGFSQAPSFNGYILQDKVASIMVTEMPAPYDKLVGGFTKEKFAERNIDLVSKEDVDVSGMKGMLVNIKQKLGSVVMEKWITIFGDGDNSVTVMTSFPEQFASELSAKLKASVMSASWDQSLSVNTSENLNFSVSEKAPFKLARRIQNMLLFSKEGAFPAKSKTDPLFLVGESFYNPMTGDHKEFCTKRIKQIRTLGDMEGIDPEPIEIDGLKGFSITASAVDKETNEKMFVYQVIVFTDKSYFIQQGVARDTDRKETEPLFKQMSESFKLTKK